MNTTIKIVLATSFYLFALTAAGLAADASLHGRVVETMPEGRIVGMAAGAKIELYDEAANLVATAKSDDNGYYKTPLAPGRYYYRVTAAGFRNENSGRGLEHRLTSGYSLKNFALVRGISSSDAINIDPKTEGVGELYGRVCTLDESGNLVAAPGARLRLRRLGTSDVRKIAVNTTPHLATAGGAYKYALPAGNWRASVDAPGMRRLVLSEPIKIESAAETERNFILERIPAQLVEGKGIRGVVVLDRMKVTPGVSPPITLVFRSVDAKRAFRMQLELNTAGSFSQDLPVGTYRVAAFATGHRPDFSHPILVTSGGYATVTLRLTPKNVGQDEPSQDPPSANSKLSRSATLTVTAIGNTSDGLDRLANAKISLQQFDDKVDQPIAPSIQESSGIDGSARFVELEPGDYRLSVEHPEFELQTIRIHLEAEKAHRQPFVLQRSINPRTAIPAQLEKEPSRRTLITYVVYKNDRGGVTGVANTRVVFEPHNDTTLRSGGELDALIARADANHDNRLTRNEIVGRLGGAAERFRAGDVDRDGALSKHEFEQLVANTFPTRSPSRAFSVTSGENGRIEVELPLGDYRVITETPQGFAAIEQTLRLGSIGAFDYIYVKKLTPRAPVRQILTVKAQSQPDRFERGAQPLESAVVVVTPLHGGERQVGRTYSNGKHSFSVAPGDYRLDVKLSGYEPQTASITIRDNAEVDLTLRKDVRTPSLAQAHLNVQVFGTASSAEQSSKAWPLSAAEVRIARRGGGYSNTALTDVNGLARFKIDHYGTYDVEAAFAGFERKTTSVVVNDQHRIALTLSRQSQSAAREVAVGIRVLGRNTSASAGAIRPLAGANVTITSKGRPIASGRTTIRGEFTVSLAEGTQCVVSASLAGYNSNSLSFVAGDSAVTPLVLDALQQSQKTGTALVIHDALNPLQTLSQSRITVTGPGRSAMAEYSARYRIYKAFVPPGRYRVTIEHEGYRSQIIMVDVGAGTPIPRFVGLHKSPSGPWTHSGGNTPVPATRPLQLSVLVKSARGEFGALNLPGALVTVSQHGRPVAAGLSNSAGVFTARVPGGTYKITVLKSGYQPSSSTVTVTASLQTQIDLRHSLGATPEVAPRGQIALPNWSRSQNLPRKPQQKPTRASF